MWHCVSHRTPKSAALCSGLTEACIPTVLAISSAKLRRGKVMLRNAVILSVAKRKLRKFFRMQYSGENFDAVDNPRAWTRKVSARINQINLAGARSRKRIKARKFS